MEFWILIAAAGSGYLAHIWQSFHISKEASGSITNDDNDDQPCSPNLTTPTRKCHYASSSRRSVKGRFLQKGHVPELSQNGVTIHDGYATDLYVPVVDGSESWEAQGLRKSVRGDACTCPSIPKQFKRRCNAALSYPISGSNTSSRCLARSSSNTIWPQKYCDRVLLKEKASFNLTGDDCCSCVSNLYSEDELDSCGVNKILDCCSIRCVKDKHESNMGNAVQACLPNREWTRGYHDQPEDVCASGPSGDAHIMHECEVESGQKVRSNQVDERGSCNNLSKILLFNFGLGVGMMSAIMLSKHGAQQRIEQLEEAMSALKGLEGEIQGRKKLRLGVDDTRDRGESGSPKQSCSVLKLLRKVFQLVEQVRMSLVKDSASVSATGCEGPQERARLEAELEAELERMEMHFNPRNATNFCRRYTCEDGLEKGTIAQGELPTRHIPSDVGNNLSTLDSINSSSREYIHYGDCAVPPLELAKRLHNVLEARQEEKIMELEAEIKHLNNGLHAKERWFQAWKQRVQHLLQETACTSLSNPQKDFHEEAENTSMRSLFSSTNKEDIPVVGLECPLSFVNNEDFATNAVDSVQSLNLSISQPKTFNVGDEACEGWPQSLDNTGNRSASRLHNGLLKAADKRDLWSNGTMMIHPEVVDVSYDSVASGGSINALFDIMGSSPCSVTSMDGEIAAEEHDNNRLKNEVEMETKNLQQGFDVECNGEVTPCSDRICCSQEICAQDVIDICEDSHGQCGHLSNLNTPEDEFNSSDSDEQLGQLLIERIVRKGRKGSLIVEVAQSVMASFDFDDATLEMGLPSG